ncbi:MAG: TonB-dependent siderophore receptor, partial [Nitrospira sp.]
RHQLLLGLELSLQPISYRNSSGNLASINIFNPVYGAQPTNITLRNEQSIDINTAGPYIQDLITLLPNLKLMLGGRYDYIDRQLSDRVIGVNTSRQDTRFSPRVGLVYEPFEGITFYAGYSTSFIPVSDITAIRTQSKLFAPEIGKQYEVGVKLDLSKRLTATVAGYELKRENVLTTSPTDQTVSIAVGEQRSRGAEVDLTYQIIAGWNVLVAYAYTDAEVTKDNAIQIGNRPNNVPMNSARLWSSYNVSAGPLAGLMVGAGLYAVGRRFGDTANSFTLPGYVTVDASASYSWSRYRASLRINNLLDKTYFESADSRNAVFAGVPFTALGTIAATF